MAEPDSVLPVVDEQRIRSIFTELEKMEAELDPDPLEFGPKRLNMKVSAVRGMLTRCERVFLQASHDLQLYKRTHRGAQLDFDLQMQDLIANDPEVRAGRNVRDRDAIATMKLRETREAMVSMEVAIQDLEMVLSVIKAKRADLRDLQSRLRDQIKLCGEEIGLGSRWGSKPAPGTVGPDLDAAPRTDPKALQSLQDLVQRTSETGEVHLAPGDSKWVAEPSEQELMQEMKVLIANAEGEGEDEEDDDLIVEEEAPPPTPEPVAAPAPTPAPVTSELPVTDDETDEPMDMSFLADEDEAPKAPETPETPKEPEKVEEGKPEAGIDIFADGQDTAPEKAPVSIPPVESDDDIDSFFAKLDAEPPKKGKVADPNLGDDLDSLIDMFGDRG